MKTLITLCLLVGTIGCESLANRCTVSGSAFVETERPEGKAVAKIEVRYTPPDPQPRPMPKKPIEPAPANTANAGEADCR